jgi:hypothetical protein
MKKIIVPKTETPDSVYVGLVSIIIAIGIILLLIVGCNMLIPIILFVILGLTTQFYTHGVPAYHSLSLVSQWSGDMRVIFPGVNFKFPWEKPHEDGCLDLRVELSEVCKETYAAIDTLMKTEYVYTIRPNLSGDNPGEDIILYSSFEPEALKAKGRALFSMLLSDYYGKNKGDDLLKKEEINKEVFGTELNPSKKIMEFEKNHGAEVTILLKDSDFDERTQDFRDSVSKAKSMNEAIKVLMDGGMSRPDAEKFVKLMNTDGYTQKDFNLSAVAPDLQNLRDVTILGSVNDDKKGGKK